MNKRILALSIPVLLLTSSCGSRDAFHKSYLAFEDVVYVKSIKQSFSLNPVLDVMRDELKRYDISQVLDGL